MIWKEATSFLDEVKMLLQINSPFPELLIIRWSPSLRVLDHQVTMPERKLSFFMKQEKSNVGSMSGAPFDDMSIICKHYGHPTYLYIEMCDTLQDINYATFTNHFASSARNICNIPSHRAVILRRYYTFYMRGIVDAMKSLLSAKHRHPIRQQNLNITYQDRSLRTAARNRRRRNARAKKRSLASSSEPSQ